MTMRRDLSDGDVRRIVEDSIDMISEAQSQLNLSVAPHLSKTKNRLKTGNFKAIRLNNKRSKKYAMDFGSFIPPATIILDKRLPSSDHPLDMPDYAETLTAYSAIHEVVHADDHTGGDKLLLETRKHIIRVHQDKLEKSMSIIMQEGGSSAIKNFGDLASLWAVQYVDMVTHYRSYVVLRHKKYPKLDELWSRLRNDYFPPNLFTCIELSKGTEYVFSLFNDLIGEYCLIEALDEYKEIKDKDACSYTV
ncbi:MAG: hypothetical protein NWE89_12520 [Candidatus Bathyarchaeota archaeon]|nr:hypothetical protein [Candidatus Bathyarchaeota archaeon]